MKKTTAGLIGGFIGGIVKLSIDQTLFATEISPVNTVGSFTSLFGGIESSVTPLGSIMYIVVAAVVGLIISFILNESIFFNYLVYGAVMGLSLWVLMNIVFLISGAAIPTWSTGGAGIISDLITYFILGVIITYSIFRANVKTKE